MVTMETSCKINNLFIGAEYGYHGDEVVKLIIYL